MHYLLIIMPVHNDYESAEITILELETQFAGIPVHFEYLLVDDGSKFDSLLYQERISGQFKNVTIIRTERRSGHQNAIFSGLKWANDNRKKYHILIMDCDGEDQPKDARSIFLELVNNESRSIIAATRGRRSVSFTFKAGYALYRFLFKILTGQDINFGNFMIIRNSRLNYLLKYPYLYKHLAASINRYAPDIAFIKFDRGCRHLGKSKMNFSSLALHAAGAYSVYIDRVIARTTILFAISSFFFIFIAGTLVMCKLMGYMTTLPGWTSTIFVELVSTSLILLCISIFSLLISQMFQRDSND